GRKKRSTNRSIPGNARRDEAICATGPRLDDGTRAGAPAMTPRRDVAIDPHDRPVRAQPDEIEREAHRERVDRAAARDPERAVGRQGVEASEATPPRSHPARVVDAQAVGEVPRGQRREPPLPGASSRDPRTWLRA